MLGLVPRRRREDSLARFPSLDWTDRLMNDLSPSRFFSNFGETGDLMPAFDISEADDHIVVRADLPGIDAKDLDINLSGNVLSISGEKKKEQEQKDENYYSIERRFGSFCRTFTLPSEVKEEGVEATYKDGVLRLKIPKEESAKRKKIEVKQV